MKTSTIFFFLILSSSTFGGCTGSLFTITPEGDKATIAVDQHPDVKAELLAINRTDSILYVNMLSSNNNAIVGIKLNTISSITIRKYTNKEYFTPWIAFQAVPTILLVGAASASGVENIGQGALILALPSIFSGLILVASTPEDPKIIPSFTSSELDELNKYTRFPLGLNKQQLEKLIRMHNQKRLWMLGEDGAPLVQKI